MKRVRLCCLVLGLLAGIAGVPDGYAQTGPNAAEIGAYDGLHAAAAAGDVAVIKSLITAGANIDSRDGYGRTPLMVATFQRRYAAGVVPSSDDE